MPITDSDIRKIIVKKFQELKNVGESFEIDSIAGRQRYRIVAIVGDEITLQGIIRETKEWPVNFEKIKDAYQKRLWEVGKSKNDLDPYRAAIAKYIYNELERPWID